MRGGALACCVGCIISISIIGTLIGVNYVVAGVQSAENVRVMKLYNMPFPCRMLRSIIYKSSSTTDGRCLIIRYTFTVFADNETMATARDRVDGGFVAIAFSNFFQDECGGVTNVSTKENITCFVRPGDVDVVRISSILGRDEGQFALGVTLLCTCGLVLLLFLLYNVALIVVTCCVTPGDNNAEDEDDGRYGDERTPQAHEPDDDPALRGGAAGSEPFEYPLETGDKSWIARMATQNPYARAVISKLRRMRLRRKMEQQMRGRDAAGCPPPRASANAPDAPGEALPTSSDSTAIARGAPGGGSEQAGVSPDVPTLVVSGPAATSANTAGASTIATETGSEEDGHGLVVVATGLAAVAASNEGTSGAPSPAGIMIECPICFEPLQDSCAMFTCGHVSCVPCLQRMLSTAHHRGSMYMVATVKCPVCRCITRTEDLRTIDVLADDVSFPASKAVTPRVAAQEVDERDEDQVQEE